MSKCDICENERPTLRIRRQRIDPSMPPVEWVDVCEECLVGAKVIVEVEEWRWRQ